MPVNLVMNPEDFIKQFISRYGPSNETIHLFFAPGRVNLIGEHTDYNGGYVLPCALSFGTYMLVRRALNETVKLASGNFEFSMEVPLEKLSGSVNGHWVDFPLGIFDQFIKIGLKITGLEILYAGNIPHGAGLSSSASIEVVTAFAVNELYNYGLSLTGLARLSWKCEHEFIGVQCGIMDQFAVALGEKNHALFLDCNTQEFEQVPIKLNNYRLVIANTNKIRQLSGSKYNDRVKECSLATQMIQATMPIKNLGALSLDDFERVKHLIDDPVILQRARHVVSENQRVLDAVKALKNYNLKTFGKLMNASHDSLKNDYKVTGFELDTMVEEARKVGGVIGSRMTGAGFGGCTVNLVKEKQVDAFIEKVGEAYHHKTGLHADFYLPDIGDGARSL